jgi:hypothetical protein
MSQEYLNIGSTPPEEDCFPVGNPKAYAETALYRDQLEREFPEGDFRVKWFQHDFGRYCEVVAYYEPGEPSEAAAYHAEGESNPVWDEISAPLVAALRVE